MFDVAQQGFSIWTVDAEEPVLGAIQRMADRHIGALPVTRNGELVGVVSGDAQVVEQAALKRDVAWLNRCLSATMPSRRSIT